MFLTPVSALHNGLSSRKFPHAGKRQPMENRLAWLARNPPVARRACLIRWTEVVHTPSSWFQRLTGGPSGTARSVRVEHRAVYLIASLLLFIGICQRRITFLSFNEDMHNPSHSDANPLMPHFQ